MSQPERIYRQGMIFPDLQCFQKSLLHGVLYQLQVMDAEDPGQYGDHSFPLHAGKDDSPVAEDVLERPFIMLHWNYSRTSTDPSLSKSGKP